MGRFGILLGSLFVIVGFLWLHSHTTETFYLGKENRWAQEKQTILKRLETERSNVLLVEQQHLAFKNYVSAHLPELLDQQNNNDEQIYPVRNLASVLIRSEPLRFSPPPVERVIADGKSFFRERAYREAITRFDQVIDNHSDSPHIVEALFLKAEAFYQLKDYESSVKTVEVLLEQFPESDLTGFSLLRLAQVFERQERGEEALQIYRTVLASFSNQQLKLQAKKKLGLLDD